MTANPVLMQKKYARIIELYAKKNEISPEDAMGVYYKSRLYTLISEGVSDLHCMSDEYLVDMLGDEMNLSSEHLK